VLCLFTARHAKEWRDAALRPGQQSCFTCKPNLAAPMATATLDEFFKPIISDEEIILENTRIKNEKTSHTLQEVLAIHCCTYPAGLRALPILLFEVDAVPTPLDLLDPCTQHQPR